MGDYSTIEIRGDNESLQDSLSTAEGMFKAFGDKVMAIFSAATGVYSFDDAISKIKKGIADFEQSQEHVRALDRALRTSGEAAGFTTSKMMEMNDQIKKISKYSEDAITDAQAALSKFKNVRMDVFQDALKGATDLAEYMGTDFTSATKLLGAALNDPRKGLEDLEEAGVDFSKSQKNMIEAMLRMGNVVGAQRIILGQLAEDMGGEGAKAADTFGNRMMRWDEASEKVWKTIGGALVPWLNKLIDITDKVQVVVKSLVDEWLSGFGGDGQISISVEETAKVIGEYLMKAVDIGVQAFTVLETAIQTFESTTRGVWLTIKSNALAMFADLTDAAATVEKAIALWPEVQKAASDMWKKMVELAGWAWEQTKKYWNDFLEYTKSVFNNVLTNAKEFLSVLWDRLKGGDSKFFWKDFLDAGKHAVDEAPDLVDGMKKGVKDKLKGMHGNADQMRDDAKRAAAGAALAFQPFDDNFDDNLKKNRKKVQDFADKVKGILDDDEYKNIEGKDSGKKFKLSKPDQEERPEGSSIGAFEDLMSLNKRIQSAAMKTPALAELEKQTKLMERELDIQQKMFDQGRAKGNGGVNAQKPANDLAAVGALNNLAGLAE